MSSSKLFPENSKGAYSDQLIQVVIFISLLYKFRFLIKLIVQ